MSQLPRTGGEGAGAMDGRRGLSRRRCGAINGANEAPDSTDLTVKV